MIENYANLAPERLAELEAAIPNVASMLDLFQWGAKPDSLVAIPQVFSEVVKQDEYTHDFVMPLKNGLFLVYDST